MKWILPYDEEIIREKCYLDSLPLTNMVWTEEEIQRILSYNGRDRLFQKMIMSSMKILKQTNQ